MRLWKVGRALTVAFAAAVLAAASRYCPPDEQHPRILVAGDLKGPWMQRIAVAMGDGARGALEPYCRDRAVPDGPSTTAR
ncbi:hypothetical protein GCM10010214_02990 [Streptomyces abikoensis]|nr:hypothetical protein GCM10010214_02990 [Streptomyces abikoensis]